MKIKTKMDPVATDVVSRPTLISHVPVISGVENQLTAETCALAHTCANQSIN